MSDAFGRSLNSSGWFSWRSVDGVENKMYLIDGGTVVIYTLCFGVSDYV